MRPGGQVTPGWLVGSALVLLAAGASSTARAQASPDPGAPPPASSVDPTAPVPPTSDVATAGELFRQGRAAFESRDFATARARLLESGRLNPRVGTFISLAQCEEALGLLASARAHWQQAVALGSAQGDARASFAEEHLASIDPRVPRLTLRLPVDAPPGTVVHIDKVELGVASLGLALPAEVGKHTLVVVAPGHEPARLEVDLTEGDAKDVTLEMGALAPIPPPAPATGPSAVQRDSDTRGHGPLRVASYASLGLGVVAAGMGAYFGVKAIDGKGAPGCTGDICDPPGSATRNAAIRDGNASTVLFVGSGALLVTGVVLWLVPRPALPRTAIEWLPSPDGRHPGVSARVAW